MYIGAWQEYKLARLIQQHQNEQNPPGNQRTPLRSGLRSSSSSRSARQGDDVASLSSSKSGASVSGMSTQSAPAKLQPSQSAQSQLNDFYDQSRRREGAAAASARSQRPRSSLAPRTGRPPKPAAKKAAAKPKAKSVEQDRRARIQAMQKLYGLGSEPEQAEVSPRSLPTPMAASILDSCLPCRSSVESTQPLRVPGPMSEVDRALSELRMSMDMHATDSGGELVQASFARAPASADGILRSSFLTAEPLPPVSEDPPDFSMSLTAGSSGGLIAWSRNLCPEALSPEASLTSFMMPRA